jgi:Cu(I)/Ag(I) efflux system protein CusF
MHREILVVVALSIGLASPAFAQKAPDSHSAHPAGAKAQSAPLAEGEIRKIDRAAKKITLKHGPIASIDMPAMTMMFNLKDPAIARDFKVGDKVRFQVQMIGGSATVTEIYRAK